MIRSRIAFVFLLVCGLVALGSVSAQQERARIVKGQTDRP
jgi:hypothetical protein